MFCKTIILSNSENLNSNSPKGILTLSKENSKIKGKIRLYNLLSLPENTKVGLYVNNNVHISHITRKPNHYEFDLNENVDITQSVYCALIDSANNKKVLLEGGNSNSFDFSDSPFDAVLEAKDEQLEQNITQVLKQVDSCEHCDCANCEYKKYFYENYSISNNKIDTPPPQSPCCDNQTTHFNPPIKLKSEEMDFVDTIQSNIIDKLSDELINDLENSSFTTKSNTILANNKPKQTYDNSNLDDTNQQKLEFLNDIVYQLDEMFEQYPKDDMLNSIIPNSRFIMVDGDNPYVLGVIYEDSMLKYIAYGVPATYNSLPPKDLGQHYQWLPLNPRDVMSDGYFMIYQDAITGSLVEINFEEL